MKHAKTIFVSTVLFFAATASGTAAQTGTVPTGPTPDAIANSILQDNNGDGVLTVAAFGDSITVGEGDFVGPGQSIDDVHTANGREAGYPLRIEAYVGVSVANLGRSGEALTEGGQSRFISDILRSRPDVVIISEGYNDGRIPASPSQIYRALQKMINTAHAIGTVPVLASLFPTCQDHAFLQKFLDTYNPQIRTLAVVNDLVLADPEHAFRNAQNTCGLLNSPDGLHPNELGYDVMGEAMISALLQINIFAPDGPTLYAQALNIDPASVRTVPDPLPPPAQ